MTKYEEQIYRGTQNENSKKALGFVQIICKKNYLFHLLRVNKALLYGYRSSQIFLLFSLWKLSTPKPEINFITDLMLWAARIPKGPIILAPGRSVEVGLGKQAIGLR